MSDQVIQLPVEFEEGAFAIVIPSPDKMLGTKLFKRVSSERMRLEGRPWDNDARRATFQAEIDAYAAAMNSPEARILVPTFYGVREVSKLLDIAGKDISGDYLLDCCFTMEWLPGYFQKLYISGRPIVPDPEAKRVVDILCGLGIQYVLDTSVRVDATGQKIEKIIDFATCDAYQEEELKHL